MYQLHAVALLYKLPRWLVSLRNVRFFQEQKRSHIPGCTRLLSRKEAYQSYGLRKVSCWPRGHQGRQRTRKLLRRYTCEARTVGWLEKEGSLYARPWQNDFCGRIMANRGGQGHVKIHLNFEGCKDRRTRVRDLARPSSLYTVIVSYIQ